MSKKVKAAIIGPGNIGTDLLLKIEKRSQVLEVAAVIGIDPDSEGLRLANKKGIYTTALGLNDLKNFQAIDIYFDATGAQFHYQHAKTIAKWGKIIIDLTPCALGPYLVPVVNFKQHVNQKNINMVTCGGQATIPIVAAINSVCQVDYAEIIATAASKSAGLGTRQNIDEYTTTTKKAVEIVGGAKKAKAIIILNPAEPPITMRNTIYVKSKNYDKSDVEGAIKAIVEQVKDYVPGYQVCVGPEFDGDLIKIVIEVAGAGDYLPEYAGNLDIMTAAAQKVGDLFANRILGEE